ncbi:UNKNOWN [Stylonychia lemnae]|uniref:Uncharacterized protein n=1 Tax=Stylonychia lemnae TaxID=5949 RepID=A0A077ZUP4_STYLE|nr:UNKNOWN [Stylonychia lemnae]|eukprot:CDW73617.1 UNKNOWN [Stylonychia lemnae]
MDQSNNSRGPIYLAIEKKLTEVFNPTHLEIVDESHKHAGHHAMKEHSRQGETHFQVTVVSDEFENKPLIDRHRAVNECLAEEIAAGVHALSIKAKTQKQWIKQNEQIQT